MVKWLELTVQEILRRQEKQLSVIIFIADSCLLPSMTDKSEQYNN